MTFKSVGYYNGADAVMLSEENADKVVHNMKQNKGSFYTDDEKSEADEEEIIAKGSKYTTDGKYIVTYDVSSRFDDCPLELLNEMACDEFIDVYAKC